jgi:hypothetical protein
VLLSRLGLLDDIDPTNPLAQRQQFPAATSAIVAKARLCGFLTEKAEVNVNSFKRCETPEDVVSMLIGDFDGDPHQLLEFIDAMRTIVLNQIAQRAKAADDRRRLTAIAIAGPLLCLGAVAMCQAALDSAIELGRPVENNRCTAFPAGILLRFPRKSQACARAFRHTRLPSPRWPAQRSSAS